MQSVMRARKQDGFLDSIIGTLFDLKIALLRNTEIVPTRLSQCLGILVFISQWFLDNVPIGYCYYPSVEILIDIFCNSSHATFVVLSHVSHIGNGVAEFLMLRLINHHAALER